MDDVAAPDADVPADNEQAVGTATQASGEAEQVWLDFIKVSVPARQEKFRLHSNSFILLC